jgi:hypothetical protein
LKGGTAEQAEQYNVHRVAARQPMILKMYKDIPALRNNTVHMSHNRQPLGITEPGTSALAMRKRHEFRLKSHPELMPASNGIYRLKS